MLDVHPPHAPTHTWKDFFIHIATIAVGLLIAVGLEQAVEAIHHHRERTKAPENLREEITANRKTLAKDLKSLDSEKQMLAANMDILHKLRAHQTVAPDSLRFYWQCSSMEESAWQTAREAAAIPLFPTWQIQGSSFVYGQQALVNSAGIAHSRQITEADIPLRFAPTLAALSPSQINELLRSCASAINQIDYTQSVAATLDPMYKKALDLL